MEYKACCHCGRVRFSFRSAEINRQTLQLLALPAQGCGAVVDPVIAYA